MKCTPEERDRLIVVGILILFSLIFWALFEQAGSSLNILTDRGVDRTIMGWEVPASMFNLLMHSLYLLSHHYLHSCGSHYRKELNLNSIKFAIGIMFVGIGFLVLVFGMKTSSSIQTGVFWIMMIYLLHTIGELCLSPVGLSSVTKLSPKRIVGMMMGMWFFASAAGNFVAGLIARATASEEIGGGSAFDIVQKTAFMDVYTNVGLIALVFGIVLALASPLMKKGMHGIN